MKHHPHFCQRCICSVLFLFGSVACKGAVFTYSYDPLNRLTNAAYSDGSRETYSHDDAGNRLSRTTLAATSSADVVPPSVPTNLTTVEFTPSQLRVSWNRSFDTGGSGLAGYYVYVNGASVASTTSTNVSLSGLLPDTQYCLSVPTLQRENWLPPLRPQLRGALHQFRSQSRLPRLTFFSVR